MTEHKIRNSSNLSSNPIKLAASRTVEFRFVSGLDNSYPKSVRAHVLQRHMRNRRLWAEKRGKPNDMPGEDNDLALVRRRTRRPKHSKAVQAPAGSRGSQATTDQVVALTSTSLMHHVGPKSLLGQGTVDPFLSTAAGTMTATEDLLIDYYCGDMLAPYGITKDIRMLHPPRDLCAKMNMSDKAPMFALFTYTADLIHRRGGAAKYAAISSQYRVATIQVVKSRVEHEKPLSDTTILAVLGLVASVSDNRMYPHTPDQEHEMQLHVQGLRAMIAGRGGLSSKLYTPTVYWLLYWIDLCENGNAFPPARPFSDHPLTSSSSTKLISADEDWFMVDGSNNNIRYHVEDLAIAYANFYDAAKTRSSASLHVALDLVSSQSRALLLCPIQRGTVLHYLLCSAPGGILRSITPVLYLNLILWHYRRYYDDSSSNINEIDVFRRIMHKARLAKTVVALVWTLVTDPEPYRLHHPPLAWHLNQLLRIESRLSTHLQRTLKETLVQFLLIDEIENFEPSWLTPEQFRSAVRTDLGFES